MYVCIYICHIHIPCPAQNDYKQRTEARGEGPPLFGYVPSPAFSGAVIREDLSSLCYLWFTAVLKWLSLVVQLVAILGM